MIIPILQKIAEAGAGEVPANWRPKDPKKFGLDWELFDYQKRALENISAVLYFHYQTKDICSRYRQNGLGADLEREISILPQNENYKFLADYYGAGDEIGFEKFANRAAFWMATGSGKTLVMIKLIALLAELTQKNLIPQKDILVLAPKDEILAQIKDHIEKFNKTSGIKINFYNLKEWERVRNQQSVFGKNEANVFYYRADNIGDSKNVAKKKDGQRLDYRSILNGGNWHLILDEAHKGEKEFSKRQQYYMVLAQNGFLFNFSATFTDPLDLATTIFEYNLSSFLKDGYGKKIYLADLQFLGGREEFTDNEKKIIIAQSLIMLALAKMKSAELRKIDKKLYHSPLLMTLAHSVNTEDADLKIFFNLLAQIARGEFDFDAAKNHLAQSLTSRQGYLFDLGDFDARLIAEIQNMRRKDFSAAVFNTSQSGNIQAVKFNDNPREMAFQVVGAQKYFMLIVASDIINWEGNVLKNYEMGRAVDKSFFDDINSPARDDINILLGSRIFAEGWDTNRPNIVNFINIGVSPEAQKFVLQSIGRGVRVEPQKNQRKRFDFLDKSAFAQETAEKIAKGNQILESLAVFATNKKVVKGILSNMEKQSNTSWVKINGIKKNQMIDEAVLPIFIPVFQDGGLNERPFAIGAREYRQTKELTEKQGAKILLLKHDINLRTYNKIMDGNNFDTNGQRRKRSAEEILPMIDNYFNQKTEVLAGIEILDRQIRHFDEIKTDLGKEELEKIEMIIAGLLRKKSDIKKLAQMVDAKKITFEQALEKAEKKFGSNNIFVDFDYDELSQHYYLPLLYKLDSDHFQHIVKNKSEIDFLNDLKVYLKNPVCKLNDCEWWYFSKIEENVDSLAIPYFDSQAGEWRGFFPDFIFWIKASGKHYLKFIDPHGVEYITNTADKIDGFKIFAADLQKLPDKKIERADLFLYNRNRPGTGVEAKVKKYYTDDFDQIFSV